MNSYSFLVYFLQYLSNKPLKNIIKLGKYKINKLDKTGIVYSFKCKQCPGVYIGETKRSLENRLKEHKNNSNSMTAVTLHKRKYEHEFDYDNTKIVDNEKQFYKRRISEMLYIGLTENSINRKEVVQTLNHCYKPLLRLLNPCNSKNKQTSELTNLVNSGTSI